MADGTFEPRAIDFQFSLDAEQASTAIAVLDVASDFDIGGDANAPPSEVAALMKRQLREQL